MIEETFATSNIGLNGSAEEPGGTLIASCRLVHGPTISTQSVQSVELSRLTAKKSLVGVPGNSNAVMKWLTLSMTKAFLTVMRSL